MAVAQRDGGSAANVTSIVFAGGGNRCVWQAGFWTEAAPRLGLAPARVAAASAGAAMACVLFAGRLAHALAHFKSATAANRRNVYPANWLRGRPVFPHWAMYRLSGSRYRPSPWERGRGLQYRRSE